ncbi:hypothetical protein, partial [Klebsiella pneumoniae]|uniref:hypothetical protein n=1 Tax=Klebsiella pneumoniae TaxID=573 RepID=UPI001C71E3BA
MFLNGWNPTLSVVSESGYFRRGKNPSLPGKTERQHPEYAALRVGTWSSLRLEFKTKCRIRAFPMRLV